MYLDMNSFFASVEQQHTPAYREKPLAVASHIGPSGTVLAASYEAKAFGIRTGTRLAEALVLCPALLLTTTKPKLYKDVHNTFMAILRDMFGPEVQARSIDEAALYMASNWQTSEFAWDMSRQIKDRFRSELGTHIRCSIGIAPNSLLAKVATDLQKPDGLVEITLENLPEILGNLTLIDLPGISHRNAARLAIYHIATPLEMYATPLDILQAQFGMFGQQWWWRLHGYETDEFFGRPGLKSMSHQHALKHWLQELPEAKQIIGKMSDRLIHRLRRNNLQSGSASLYFSLLNHHHLEATIHFDSPTSSYATLSQATDHLLHQFPQKLPAPVRKISICFDRLSEYTNGWQPDLFSSSVKQESLTRALEHIRHRHGFDSVQLGSSLALEKGVADEQLGFGRIKDRIR
jgi:DNA polymerase-4